MSKNWTSTNKVVVFIVLVLSNAVPSRISVLVCQREELRSGRCHEPFKVTCIALLVVFLLVALRGTKEKSAEES